jgi:hypothetical protein
MSTQTIQLTVSDVSNQKMAEVDGIPADSTVGELVEGLLSQLRLPANGADGHPVGYHARHERAGRHLHATELVGDSLETGDHLVIQPSVHAG